MKRYFAILLVMAFAASSTQHVSARISVNVSYGYHESLDLQAVATAFYRSDDIRELEYYLNDNRYRVSNLDMNNDGYIDYLRVMQYYDYNEHVIQIQAVLGRNYYHTVATIYVGRDQYNNEFVQIVGDESIYGRDYVIQPVYHRRPIIIRWLWNHHSHHYVSPYYWGYYPRHYKVRPIININNYHRHVRRYVDNRNHYNRVENYNRPPHRTNRGQVERSNGNQRYNEVQRKANGAERNSVNVRDIKRSETRQPVNRSSEIRSAEPRRNETRQSEVRQPENRQPATPRQSEVRRPSAPREPANRAPEVRQSESRRQDISRSNSGSGTSREKVRAERTAPQRSSASSSRPAQQAKSSSKAKESRSERR